MINGRVRIQLVGTHHVCYRCRMAECPLHGHPPQGHAMGIMGAIRNAFAEHWANLAAGRDISTDDEKIQCVLADNGRRCIARFNSTGLTIDSSFKLPYRVLMVPHTRPHMRPHIGPHTIWVECPDRGAADLVAKFLVTAHIERSYDVIIHGPDGDSEWFLHRTECQEGVVRILCDECVTRGGW